MDDWFELKRYPHIGKPFTNKLRTRLREYVTNPTRIGLHAFLPFIHRHVEKRRFRKSNDPTKPKGHRTSRPKSRHLYYASQLDSLIYAYYAEILQKRYEKIIIEKSLSECVTAYRSIPIAKLNGGTRNKCNIDFAEEVFNYIRAHSYDSLVAIAFDITSFFDNLNHGLLKKQWRRVLNSGKDLPKDHYNLFKSLTKFAYVNEYEIFGLFRNEILVEYADKKIRRKPVAKRKYLREQGAVAFCEKREVETLRAGNFIKSNKRTKSGEVRTFGIPQGSPISAVLANIYLLDFDTACNNKVKDLQGIYRRYSDDIAIVCESKYCEDIKKFIENEIQKAYLLVQEEKTQVYLFENTGDRLVSKRIEGNSELKTWPLEYLGFTFDGSKTLLKSASLAGYHRKMKRAIRRGKFFASRSKSKRGELFKNKLYKRFTYLGSKRRRIFKRAPNTTDQWIVSNKFDWGNYLTYAEMAARIMTNNGIKKQIKRSWRHFHELINHTS